MAKEWAMAFAAVFAVLTAFRIRNVGKSWRAFIPGGIAVAVGKPDHIEHLSGLLSSGAEPLTLRLAGMYNVPSFTLARTIGGILSWYWRSVSGRPETPLIVLASVSRCSLRHVSLPAPSTDLLQGFILGEGFLSIVNLIMQSAGVPHL